MVYGRDYVFTAPIAFRRVMIGYQDDRTQRSIDLMNLEFALYDLSGLTPFEKKEADLKYALYS